MNGNGTRPDSSGEEPKPTAVGTAGVTGASAERLPTDDKERQILLARARQLAQIPEKEQAVEDLIECVAFQLGEEQYGIESAYVTEVVAVPELTPLPGTPEFLAGICNIRGRITSVVNLKALLGLPRKGLSDFHTVIVARSGSMEMGLLVDRITGTNHVRRNVLQPPPPETQTSRTWIKALTAERLALLDAAALLANSELVIRQEL